jgi:hypothetical protein
MLASSLSQVAAANSALFTLGSGTTLVMIPLNVKLGYSVLSPVRLSVHGGANVFYRSRLDQIGLGGTNNRWAALPNFGGDVDVSVGRGFTLSVRPDVTFASTGNLFAVTLGVGYIID